jgi:hypothetical protein
MILTWLANVASPRPEPAIQSPPAVQRASPAPDTASALAFDVEREAQRLRLRLADAPVPRRTGRDPFKFQESRMVEAPQPGRDVTAPSVEAAALSAPAATAPALKLIGVAERSTADGTIRSAVISGPDDVFIVGVDDQLLGRFTVVAVAAETVELLDATMGRPLRLALR